MFSDTENWNAGGTGMCENVHGGSGFHCFFYSFLKITVPVLDPLMEQEKLRKERREGSS